MRLEYMSPGSLPTRFQANMAHVRPDSGLGSQVKVLKTFQGVPSSLGAIAGALDHVGASRKPPRHLHPEPYTPNIS